MPLDQPQVLSGMNKLTGDQSADLWVKRLTYVACACWLVSLTLPGLTVDTRAEPWYGGAILIFGILFGWVSLGWAAYANIFFVIAARKLITGDQPRKSIVAMLAFAATLPFFQGVVRDEGSGHVLPVVSWGWGAVIWLISLQLLAMASGVRVGKLSISGMKVIFALLAVGVIAISGLHLYQRVEANSQERSLFLSSGLAFTNNRPCGIPLTNVESPVLSPGTIVTLDIAPHLVTASAYSPYLWLPRVMNYQEGEFAWVTFPHPIFSGNEVKVRVDAKADRPVLQARSSNQGAVIRILESPSGPILYEQNLKATSAIDGRRLYCPMSTQGFTGLKMGYDTILLRALGQESHPPASAKLIDETARMRCDLGTKDIDGIKGLREWDGRQAIVQPESIRTRPGFCSTSYVVLTYISEMPDASDLSPVAEVFDRKTLRPLAVFNDHRPCRSAKCQEAPRDIARGVRISDKEIVIETTRGNLVATRFQPT